MSVQPVGGNTAKAERSHSLVHFDPRVEVWEPEGGAPMFTYFQLPMKTRHGVPVPPSNDHVEKAFLETGKKWLNSMHKDGWIAIERSVACLGPYLIPDIGNLDMWTFYIGCRFKRKYPQILTLDQEQTLRDTPHTQDPTGRDFRKFLSRIANLGWKGMEKNIAGVAEKAKEEAKLRDEVDQINKQRFAKGGG